MLKITMLNEGGELDSRTAATGEEAVAMLVEMIEEAGSLNDGDRFTVTEIEG